MTKKNEKKFWIEVSDKESDWRECFKVCVRSFMEDPLFVQTHPDPAIRKRFLETYFDWVYDGILKDRGVLAVIKWQDKNGVKIIGGTGLSIGENESAISDDSLCRNVDEDGWNRYRKRIHYEDTTYLPIMKAAAEKLGTTLVHGVFLNVDDGYRAEGIGTRLIMKGIQMSFDEIMRRQREKGIMNLKPPLVYGIADSERARNFWIKIGFIEVAEIPTPGDAYVSEEVSRICVGIFPPKDPTWVDVVRKEFGTFAKL